MSGAYRRRFTRIQRRVTSGGQGICVNTHATISIKVVLLKHLDEWHLLKNREIIHLSHMDGNHGCRFEKAFA